MEKSAEGEVVEDALSERTGASDRDRYFERFHRIAAASLHPLREEGLSRTRLCTHFVFAGAGATQLTGTTGAS